MKTKKQEELINSFLSIIDDETGALYKDIILYLSELGYNPHKQRSYIVFKHIAHNKQMAKTGKRINKDLSPFFALRFSACRDYSDKFAEIVKNAITGKQQGFFGADAGCIEGGCNFCAGIPDTHVYKYTFEDGATRTHCGAVPLEITNISFNDIEEIKRLIKEQHIYLMKYQAGITVV
jgi:hypothetical protein